MGASYLRNLLPHVHLKQLRSATAPQRHSGESPPLASPYSNLLNLLPDCLPQPKFGDHAAYIFLLSWFCLSILFAERRRDEGVRSGEVF